MVPTTNFLMSKIVGFIRSRLVLRIPRTKKDLLGYVDRGAANLANPNMNKHVAVPLIIKCSNILGSIGITLTGN